MTPAEWAGLFVAVFTLIGGFATATRWLVKHYLYELKPNAGMSLRDSVNRLEARVDEIMLILVQLQTNSQKKSRKIAKEVNE